MGQQNALLHKSKVLDTQIEILANPEKQYAFSTTFSENTTHWKPIVFSGEEEKPLLQRQY